MRPTEEVREHLVLPLAEASREVWDGANRLSCTLSNYAGVPMHGTRVSSSR